MSSHIIKTLIAVAVASTLTACASHRDTEMDTAADTSMPAATAMDQNGYATASTTQAAPTTDQAVAQTTTTDMSTQSTMATQQTTAAGTMQDTAQVSTMSTQSMDGQISAAGAMKTEIVEGSQMGASTGGATASSMDQQAVCGMYADLKSARTTAEREKVMTQILLNVPRGDSALVDVREQCGSAAP